MTPRALEVTPLVYPPEVWLKQALLSPDTLLFGGYALGPPGREQIVDQLSTGAYVTNQIPGLRGAIVDLAYDRRSAIFGTSAAGQLFKLAGNGAVWVSTSSSSDPEALSLAAGFDGTVIAYSSSAAYAIQGAQPQALPSPPSGITSLGVQSATAIAAIAGSVLYEFDGTSWRDSGYHGEELQKISIDTTPFPPPKVVAGADSWAVIGAAGILVKRGPGPWRSLAQLRVPLPHPSSQSLSGTFLPDGTLVVGSTDGLIDVLAADDMSWCPTPNASPDQPSFGLTIGASIWLIDAASLSDGSLVTFGSRQGGNLHPFVVRAPIN
jgi:hypothetical protein